MPNHLTNYQKQKDFLVCVDSDGCAMDTMDVKHIRCFGPCMVTEWKLEKWQDEILARWNEINLYTMTRGINRFKGLSMALQEINEKYCPIEDLDTLTEWAANSPELSNDAVKRAMSLLIGIGSASRFSLYLGNREPESAARAAGNGISLMVNFPMHSSMPTWLSCPVQTWAPCWMSGNSTACWNTRTLSWPRMRAARLSVSGNC